MRWVHLCVTAEAKEDQGKEMTKISVQIVVQKIAGMRQELNERFSVRQIGVFGSLVRGDEGPESDVDIIVDLANPTFDNYMDLKFKLEEVLQRPVDLVMADTVKPRLKKVIAEEVVYA